MVAIVIEVTPTPAPLDDAAQLLRNITRMLEGSNPPDRRWVIEQIVAGMVVAWHGTVSSVQHKDLAMAVRSVFFNLGKHFPVGPSEPPNPSDRGLS